MKVLWLCSWLPHSTDAFDGDFIERHASAVSRIQPIDVIHVVQNPALLQNETLRSELRTEHNLRVQVQYIPAVSKKIKLLNTLLFNRRYYRQLLKVLKTYIEENGIPDLVHVHVPVKIGAGALWLKRKYNIPFVVTEHSNVYHNEGNENIHSYSAYFRYVTRKVFATCDELITVSHFLGNAVAAYSGRQDITIIPNVVDTSLFFYREKKSATPFRFLHVSNLYPVKNPVAMLQAIQLFLKEDQEAEFVFIGNKTKEWETIVAEMGIAEKNVRFMGELLYRQVAEQMREANVFFLFSKSETFSCVTAEALCSGLPVVASSVGALPELINTSNGLLTEPGNIVQFASALAEIKANYSRFNFSDIAKKAAVNYNYDTVAAQIVSVYRKTLKK